MPAMVLAAREGTRRNTAAKILDSAFRSITDVGLSRTTVEDVARLSGVARQTVYRYYPSKEHLMVALLLREEEKFLDGIRTAFAAQSDLEQACREGIQFCLRFAREHPLLGRLLERDAETFLPFLTTRAEPVVARAREALIELIATKAWVRAALLEQAVDTAVRMVISYTLTPSSRRPQDVARDLARILTLALTGREATAR
jgi:AcrR family transcriptional regulator